MEKLSIKTLYDRQVIDITDKINESLDIDEGVVNIFVTHTTAAITTADLDPGGTDLDYLDAFEKIVPDLNYRHPHDPQHMPDHILSSVIGTSISVPVKNNKLLLGTWQKIVLFELDGPRERTVIISS